MTSDYNIFIEMCLSPSEMFYFKQTSKRVRELIQTELIDKKKTKAEVTDHIVAKTDFSAPNKRGVVAFYGEPMRWVVRMIECRDNPVPRADVAGLLRFRQGRKLNWSHSATMEVTFKGRIVEDGSKSSIKACMVITHKPGWAVDLLLALSDRFSWVTEYPLVSLKEVSGEERARLEALMATIEFRLVFRPGNFSAAVNQDVPGIVEDIDYLNESLKLTYDPCRNSGYNFVDTEAVDRETRQAQTEWEEKYVAGLRKPVAQVIADGGGQAEGFWPVYQDGSLGNNFIQLASHLGAKQAVSFSLLNKVGKYLVNGFLTGRQVVGESNQVDQQAVLWMVQECRNKNISMPSEEWLAGQLSALHADFHSYWDEHQNSPAAANITYGKFWEMRRAGAALVLSADGTATDFGIPGPGDQLSGSDLWGDPPMPPAS